MNLSVFYTHNNPSVVIFDDLTIFDGIVNVISDALIDLLWQVHLFST